MNSDNRQVLNVKRTRTPGLKMASVKIQHKNCLQRKKYEEKNKHVICRPTVLSTARGRK